MTRLLTTLLSLALFLAARAASAATVRVEEPPRRVDANGAEVASRPATQTPEGVNRRDCDDDLRLAFSLEMTDFQANAVAEVWASAAGGSCADASSRSSSTRTCWPIARGLPLKLSSIVTVPVRSLMSGATSPLNPVTDASVCGTVDRTSIAVQFLYFEPGNAATAAATQTVTIEVDTIGPSAPKDARVTGDGTVTWVIAGEPPTTTSVYCAPIDAVPACVFAPFAPDTLLAADLAERYQCAAPKSSDLGFRVQGTQEGPFRAGSRYAFALSGVDAFGNPSPLSTNACAVIDQPAAAQTPDADPDGADGCTTTRGPRRGSTGVILLLALAWAAFARRRAA